MQDDNSMINVRGNLLDLSSPLVMGILNLTPDSFYDGGNLNSEPSIIETAAALLNAGATILDLGAYSSRPGASEVSEQTELERLLPALKTIVKHFPNAIISVDTFRSEVVRQAVAAGAAIVNDISGGSLDNELFKTVGELKAPYVLMHMQGSPRTMQNNPQYTDVVGEVYQFFTEKIIELKAAGVKDIILDPGFGFGKTLEHNYQLLNALPEFKALGYPVLIGASRKSMINKLLKISPQNALNGTTVLNTMALERGASILRVHDVKEAMEAVKIVTFAERQNA